MKKYSLIVVALLVLVATLEVGKALAAGSWYNYNLTVPRLNGSTTTNNQTKASASDKAVVCSHSIGSNYTLRARIETLANSPAAGYQNIDDLQRREYTLNPSIAGDQYHARVRSFPNIFVDVQAIGWWSPDNPGTCGF